MFSSRCFNLRISASRASGARGAAAEIMIRWAGLFLLAAILAGVCGFGSLPREFTDVARILFVVFVALFLMAILAGKPGGDF